MARYEFGQSADSTVAEPVGDNLTLANGLTVTFWSAATGGVQYTDFVSAVDGTTAVGPAFTIGADGILPRFLGPDGVAFMWLAGTGGARVRVPGQWVPSSATFAPLTHAAQHGSTGTDPVTPASIGAATAAGLADGLAAKAPLASPALTGTPTVNGEPIIDSSALREVRLGAADGVASLGSDAKVPIAQLPTAIAATASTVPLRDTAGRLRGFDAAADLDLVNLRGMNAAIASGGGGAAAGGATRSEVATSQEFAVVTFADVAGLSQTFAAGDIVLVAAVIDYQADATTDFQIKLAATGTGTRFKGWMSGLVEGATTNFGTNGQTWTARLTQSSTSANRTSASFAGLGLAAVATPPIRLEALVTFTVAGSITLQAALTNAPGVAGTVSARVLDGSYMACGRAGVPA